MMKPLSFTILLLALCSFPTLVTAATDKDIWWETAQREAEEGGYKLIDTEELVFLLNTEADAVILDVRADYEHEAGHIPGSDNMEFDLGDRFDLPAEKRAAFEAVLGEDKQRKVVIYCRSFR